LPVHFQNDKGLIMSKNDSVTAKGSTKQPARRAKSTAATPSNVPSTPVKSTGGSGGQVKPENAKDGQVH
jgi:hypothetical protein